MAKIKYHSITSLNTFLLLAPALLYLETVGIQENRGVRHLGTLRRELSEALVPCSKSNNIALKLATPGTMTRIAVVASVLDRIARSVGNKHIM